MPEPNARLFKSLRLYCLVTSIAVMGLGCVVLYGWAFGIEPLNTVFPGLVTMKVNKALGLTFSGASLWLLLPAASRTFRGHIARFLAFVVALIGAATLTEFLSGLNLGIDEFLLKDPKAAYGTSAPGLMAPTTAAAFLSIGLALILLDWRTRRGRRPSYALSLFSGLIAMIAICAYIYHASALYKLLLYTQMALHTAIAFLLLSIAVFFARPRTGIAGDLTGVISPTTPSPSATWKIAYFSGIAAPNKCTAGLPPLQWGASVLICSKRNSLNHSRSSTLNCTARITGKARPFITHATVRA